jgi:small GTP-binding protein
MEEEIGEQSTVMPKTTAGHVTLQRMFHAHEDVIWQIAWSPDGTRLASASADKTICIWNVQTTQLLHTIKGHTDNVFCVAWSPDGTRLASASKDKTVRIWDAQTAQLLHTIKGHTNYVYYVAWSPDGTRLASASRDKTIRIWDAQTARLLHTLEGHTASVYCVAWSPDRSRLASASRDETVRIWDAQTAQLLHTLEGHNDFVNCVVWSPDGSLLASSSGDRTIHIWNSSTMQSIMTLEGHNDFVDSFSFSNDDYFLASRSGDGKVDIWNTSSWETVELLENVGIKQDGYFTFDIAFHPQEPILATVDPHPGRDICIWDVNIKALLNAEPIITSIHYTSAKIALVGDSGVGKSGLGYRIAEERFQITESTHGQQFWIVEKLAGTHRKGMQCEAILWDFAGQPNFRPIHSLFLDDIDLALVVFDPSRADSMEAVKYWLKQLSYKERVCPTILVAARTDVSTMTLSSSEFETFCHEHAISGGFIATSAKANIGIDELIERINEQLDWNRKPTTVTTETFKRIKDYVKSLKVRATNTNIIVTSEQLYTLLKDTDPEWKFDDNEMMEGVKHLQNHGYVTILRLNSNEQSVLLAPDLLINLASSFLLRAQANEKGLGSLDEALILHNAYRFNEIEPLNEMERDTLLDAATELFLNHSLCFRESMDNRTFLIFPSLILERPPRLVEDANIIEDLTYVVTGEIENLYAALVVLLGYSPTFQRMNHWRKRAQYETVRNEICGFKLTNDDTGELELVLYYGKDVPDFVRSRFQGLFEEILHTRQVKVKKYETALSSVKRFIHEEKLAVAPTCFISYAWGDAEHERWVSRLARDLKLADLHVILDKWDNATIGASITRFVSLIEKCDFIIAIGTPSYRQKYENEVSPQGSVVAAEVDLINQRYIRSEAQKATVKPLLLTGDELTSFPPFMLGRVYADFTREEDYLAGLFELVLTLYSIPFDDPLVLDWREKLRDDAKNFLSKDKGRGRKIK